MPLDALGFISRQEHIEFAQRMDDEHKRQNYRINELEEAYKQNNKLLASVEKLALSMETMQKELTKQGNQIAELESRDGDKWRKIISHGCTAIVTILVTYICKQIGIF